jgi:hypothetical protein
MCRAKHKYNVGTDTDALLCDNECAAWVSTILHLHSRIQDTCEVFHVYACSEHDALIRQKWWRPIRKIYTSAATRYEMITKEFF